MAPARRGRLGKKPRVLIANPANSAVGPLAKYLPRGTRNLHGLDPAKQKHLEGAPSDRDAPWGGRTLLLLWRDERVGDTNLPPNRLHNAIGEVLAELPGQGMDLHVKVRPVPALLGGDRDDLPRPQRPGR